MFVLALFCLYSILVTISGSPVDISKLNKPAQASKDVKQKDIVIEKSPAKSRQEKEQLFEAYNLLHTLAQVFYSCHNHVSHVWYFICFVDYQTGFSQTV